MKYLALAILLAVLQTASPVSRTAPDNAKSSGENVKQGSGNQRTPSGQPSPHPNIDKQSGDTTTDTHAQETIVIRESVPMPKPRKDWWDKASVIFAGLLVGIGGYGVWMAKKSLKVIERQAVSMRRQTTHLKNSVIQARDAAIAAKKSADALIASERAWVMVDIEWQMGAHVFEGDSTEEGPSTGIYVNYVCRNLGKSFAQIIEKGYVFKRYDRIDEVPDQPDLSNMEWIEFTNEYVPPNSAAEPFKLSGVRCPGRRFVNGTMLFYGRVDYRDVYGEHATRFGYMITPQGVLVRLPAATYPEYNKHT
jgi:hypothetical protein